MNDSKNKSATQNPGNPGTRTIRVGALARVEGEGALHLVMDGDRVEKVHLEIYEPPRFYEAFLRGRGFMEVPDITARICGICPVAYQMGSAHALEKAMGVFDDVTPEIRTLRDLLYCGEWIESHVLHMFMLHLPDFLGYESALSMAEDHGDTVKQALRIKKLGNTIMDVIAGRSVHPVNVCVGGFYKAPDPDALKALLPEIDACLDLMCKLTVYLAEHVTFPDFERDYEFVALCPDEGYSMNLGRIKSNKGLDVSQEDFGKAIEEQHVEHSTSLHTIIKGRGEYLVGPLARLNLKNENLHPRALEILPKVCKLLGKALPWRNNFYSLPARGIETIHALALAADIIRGYDKPTLSRVPITPRAGRGAHGTEAPRGVCWHEYQTDHDGGITFARIIPPTSQNQTTIESDLRLLARQVVDLTDQEAALRCEHLIRNYDPCISCSVHFLKFERTRRGSASATRVQV
jgi:coenzyme F420-reducing hydrogenase alpha subunit